MASNNKLFNLIAFTFFLSLFSSSAQQICSTNPFFSSGLYRSCADLSHLHSFLYWNYDPQTGHLRVAFRRHVGIATTASKWVAWGINPNGLATAMVGAQALVALRRSDGRIKAYTSQIAGYDVVTLAEGDLMYPVSDLMGRFENGEMVLSATLLLPINTTLINQVWQEGPVSGDQPVQHAMDPSNFQSKGTLNLLLGSKSENGSGSSKLKKRNFYSKHLIMQVHGILNAMSWGILMPMGVIIARYVKVFADPAWFYLHVACQISGYVIGVAGWATGLKLGSESAIDNTTHRNIGIALFALATLQVLALLVRPKKDHKYRQWWNMYHRAVGYSVIILSIVNILRGLKMLKAKEKWKLAYGGSIGSLLVMAVLLEAFTWVVVWRRNNIQNQTKCPMMNNNNTSNGGANNGH